MRGLCLFCFILIFNYMLYSSSGDNQCQDYFTANQQVTFNEENATNSSNAVTIGQSGLKGAFVVLYIDPTQCFLDNVTRLIITDYETGFPLADIRDTDLDNLTRTVINSFSSEVSLYLDGDPATGTVTVDYALYNFSSTVVNGENEYPDGVIDGYGDDNCTIVNFRKTWLVSADTGNVVHYNLANLTLRDDLGDYLAIGTGTELFAQSPSMLISGNRMNYKPVDVYGEVSYVHLFAKYYSADVGFYLFYNSSLYVPPTDEPPTTVLPPVILNITTKWDIDMNNVTTIEVALQDLTDTIEKYATLTCQDKRSSVNVSLAVDVTEIAVARECLVIVYYIDVYNGTCQGNKTFTIDSYNLMIANYSAFITSPYGYVGTSCPSDNIGWIIAVVVVLVLSLFITLFVALKKEDFLYKKLHNADSVQQLVSEATVTKLPDTSEIDQRLSGENFHQPSVDSINHYLYDRFEGLHGSENEEEICEEHESIPDDTISSNNFTPRNSLPKSMDVTYEEVP